MTLDSERGDAKSQSYEEDAALSLRGFEVRVDTGEPVIGALVILYDLGMNVLDSCYTDARGMWEFTGLRRRVYNVKCGIPVRNEKTGLVTLTQVKWNMGLLPPEVRHDE